MGQQHSADSGLDKEERGGGAKASGPPRPFAFALGKKAGPTARSKERGHGVYRAPTPTKIPSGGQSKRLQGHFVAQAFQPPDQGSADSVHVDPIQVIRTEFPV